MYLNEILSQMCIRDRGFGFRQKFGYHRLIAFNHVVNDRLEPLETSYHKSVSYTHLDVYKRQVYLAAFPQCSL